MILYFFYYCCIVFCSFIPYFHKKATGKYLTEGASYPAVWQESASGWVKLENLPPSGRQEEEDKNKARVTRELDVSSPFMSHGEREEEERLRHRFSKVLINIMIK
jgi:hypothetical protein